MDVFGYLDGMKYISGKDRSQTTLFPTSLEDIIEDNNTVRSIDLFVEQLDMSKLGFKTNFMENGRPGYHPKALLKLFIYGYMNRIRYSRQLEKECRRNLEVMWLLESLTPDHNTISNFRKDNSKAIKRTFHATVTLARNFGLIGAQLIAGDGTKMRAQNSKKNNYNLKKVARHIEYIDNKLDEYNRELEQTQDPEQQQQIKQHRDKQQQRRSGYDKIKSQLEDSQDTQLSTSDPDSRHLIVRNNITEVAYNIQSTVDAQHCIPIDYHVTNSNDRKAMGNMLRRAKTILRTKEFTALFDKGYHTGSELCTAHQLDIDTLVAIPGIGRGSQAPDPNYNSENFQYNDTEDTYTCPEGNTLKSNGSWYTTRNYRFKQYKTKKCRDCKVRALCTASKVNGKVLQRSQYQEYIENNAQRVEDQRDTYKRRQAIVEHPFGTIKRQWGFDHILTKKTKQRASADVGFIFIAYNLKRILKLLKGKGGLKDLHRAIICQCRVHIYHITTLYKRIDRFTIQSLKLHVLTLNSIFLNYMKI